MAEEEDFRPLFPSEPVRLQGGPENWGIASGTPEAVPERLACRFLCPQLRPSARLAGLLPLWASEEVGQYATQLELTHRLRYKSAHFFVARMHLHASFEMPPEKPFPIPAFRRQALLQEAPWGLVS